MSYLEEMKEHWRAEHAWEADEVVYVSHKLMYHYALLVDVNHEGYAQRYCYKNLELLKKAMNEFLATGELKYWHKDHTRNLSVQNGGLFPSGELETPENQVGVVSW